MRKSGDVFFVNLPLATTIEILREAILSEGVSNELVSEYGDTLSDNGFYVMVFEKYYMRSSNRASLTVCIHNADKKVRVFSVGSGGGQGTIFSFDWGASDAFENIPRKSLDKFIC